MNTAKNRKIDNCLSVRNGHLYVEDCDTTELVERYGSPLFILSEAQLRSNVRQYKEAFSKYWPDGDVEIFPAIKANLTLASRRILTQEGAGADVYSSGELFAALKAGVNPEKISVNGGGKSEKMIRKCVEAGVRITVEDIDEPDLINKVAGELGKVAKVRFRVKPDFPNLWKKTDFGHEFSSIDMGIQIYKSGIPAQYLPELGRKVIQMKNLKMTGIHFHGGRHHASLWYWEGLMKQYAKLIAYLTKEWGGYKLEEIDIGGGYAVSRDPHSKLNVKKDTVQSFFMRPVEVLLNLFGSKVRYRIYSKIFETSMVKEPAKKKSPTVDEYAKAAAGTLRSELIKNNIDVKGVKLQVEPGRSLYGNIGIHVSTVKKLKCQTKPVKLNWALLDTTQFFLTGGALEYNFHDYIVANKANHENTMVADIVGQSCYGDRILPFAKIPHLESGDIIAFFDTGAYQEVSASNFNALTRPATILINKAESDLIKRSETIEEIFNRDIIPNRLSDK